MDNHHLSYITKLWGKKRKKEKKKTCSPLDPPNKGKILTSNKIKIKCHCMSWSGFFSFHFCDVATLVIIHKRS
jgi:hypothetical protein